MAVRSPCCAPCGRSRLVASSARRHVHASHALPTLRIVLDENSPRPQRPTAAPIAVERFSARQPLPADLPWVESWCSSLGLLPLPAGRVRSRVLLIDGKRVGFIAGREDWLDLGRGREAVLWIASAFLVPSARGQGNLARFAQLLTAQLFPDGVKLATRVAGHNTRMHGFMRAGGWRKLSATRQHADFVLELHNPYRPRG